MFRFPAVLCASFLICGVGLGRAGEPDPDTLAEKIEAAWNARDVAQYLACWRFEDAEAERSEQLAAQDEFAAQEVELRVERAGVVKATVRRAKVPARFFSATEPRGRVSQAMLVFEKNADGWMVVSREAVSDLDSLMHLSLDPQPFDAQGLTLSLPDLDVRMEEGSLFLSPPSLGPTVALFSGKATVDFHPSPSTERAQLRQYSGKERLSRSIGSFFLRVHPAKLLEWLGGPRLVANPRGASRYAAAKSLYDKHVAQFFIVDAPLPRSPWWLVPALGDAALVFDGPKGPLTYALDSSNPEGVSLFDRPRRRQICLYAADGRPVRYNEDSLRAADVLHHDLRLRVDLPRNTMVAEDTLKIDLLQPLASLRLRLADGFAVQSVRVPDRGGLLFFRVRNQDSVMVALGSLGSKPGPLTLQVRYAGPIPAGTIEDEVLQGPSLRARMEVEDVILDDVRVLTNRVAWYPSITPDDYATSSVRFDLASGVNAVTGGTRGATSVEGERSIVEYSQTQPGKYVSAAIGRLVEAGSNDEGGVELRTFAVPRLKPEGAKRAEEARKILRFYVTLFGPCPYKRINLTLLEGSTPGGHSPPGMVVLTDRPMFLRRPLRDDPANFLDVPGFFLAHELAHQWWGHGLSGESYHERWLSEGFAQYAAALWIRESRGEEVFRDVMARMARWALRLNSLGPVSLGFRLGHVKGDPQVFRAIVYDKAACVLHMLRGLVGEDGFFEALRRLQRERQFSKIGTPDVRRALEQAAGGRSLTAFFDAWIDGVEPLELGFRYDVAPSGDGFVTTVAVYPRGLPGSAPLLVSLLTNKKPTAQRVELAPEGSAYTFSTRERVDDVELNSDGVLLAVVRKTSGRGGYSR